MRSPGKYIQGPGFPGGELDRYLPNGDGGLLVLLSEGDMRRFRTALDAGFTKQKTPVDYQIFSGACTRKKVEQYAATCREIGAARPPALAVEKSQIPPRAPHI